MQVTNYTELLRAVEDGEQEIRLENSISIPTGFSLKKGQRLIGDGENIFLSVLSGDGIALAGDNAVENLAVQTAHDRRAIYISSVEKDLGTVFLRDLTVTGVVQLLTRGENETLAIEIENLDIVSADARAFPERPMKYGVNVYQGALTIYNFNPKEESRITVRAEGVSVGREKAPVLGSGIFISGFNDESGPVRVERLVTDAVYSNGMIPTGQPNLITGGIFIVYGVDAEEILSRAQVETYGTNDMVLDVWGHVHRWVVEEDVISRGPSGIGFVNFGEVDSFLSKKTIRTHGLGARGFNQYDGTVKEAYFERIETAGDGSIGMQFSKPVGEIVVGTGVYTRGGSGETLVKGEIQTLLADGISVLEGGEIESLRIEGNLETRGDGVVSYHVNGGAVKQFVVEGDIVAAGKDARKVVVENGGTSGGDF